MGHPLQQQINARRAVGHGEARAPADPGGDPFPRRTTDYDSFAPLPGGTSAPLPPQGVERRLVRRAEALWHRLRGHDALPPASNARVLLTAPFASSAMLFIGRRCVYIGADLARLGVTEAAAEQPPAQSSGPFAAHLAGLAAAAVRKGQPMLFDTSERHIPFHGTGSDGELLARAVALPFSPSGNRLSSAIVVASWRRILSEEATSAIYAELRAGK